MNLIVCDKCCVHQREGHCMLDEPTGVTAGADITCAYFSRTPTYQTHGVAAPQWPVTGCEPL